MRNDRKELMGLEPMEKLFDCIRLIDIERDNLYTEYRTKTFLTPVPALDFESRKELYHRCLASDAAIYQIEQEGELLILLAVLPVYIDQRKLIMECIANITGRIDMTGLFSQRTAVLDNAYRLSITDELTGVYNRRYINQKLPLAISDCAKRDVPLSVIFADLDYFKEVNDSYGHAAGDYLLYEFAIELQRDIRMSTDWVARYGGDEFLMCFTGTDNKKAKAIAERIRKTVEYKTFVYREHEIKTTCSLGICTIDDFQIMPTCDSILKEIDKRLYGAKKAGRNMIS